MVIPALRADFQSTWSEADLPFQIKYLFASALPIALSMTLPDRNQPNSGDLPCALPSASRVLEFLSRTLTSQILEILDEAPAGARRYNEMHRLFPATSKRTLTLVLRRLERVEVVKRQAFAQVPTRVEYSLTPLGRTFLEPLRQLAAWARAHPGELDAVLADAVIASETLKKIKPRQNPVS